MFLISFLNTFADPYAIKSSAYLKYIFSIFIYSTVPLLSICQALFCLLQLVFNSFSQNPVKQQPQHLCFIGEGKIVRLHFQNLIPEIWFQNLSQVVLVRKSLPANPEDPRDTGSIPGIGGYPGEGNGNPPQYSCLENPLDRGAWQTSVHAVTSSQTWLKWLSISNRLLSR